MRKVNEEKLNAVVGVPWKEDGRSFEGADCTGVLQLYYNSVGILAEAPRISEGVNKDPQQILEEFNDRNHIVKIDELQPEDVMVFRIDGLIHVGMYLGYGKLLHAHNPHKSRISPISKNLWSCFCFGIRPKDGQIYMPPAGAPLMGAGIYAALIGAGVGFATGGGWKAAALGFVGGLFFGIAGVLIAGAIGYSMQNRNRSSSASSPRYSFGELKTTSTNQAVLPLVYGEVRLAGNVVYQNPISGGSDIDVLVAFAHGEIESFSDVRINGQLVSEYPGCTYQAFTGTAAQNVETSTGLDLDGIQYRRVACIHFHLQASEKLKDSFNITAIVKGLKVSTWNGAIWSTEKTYSDNPYACIRDYLTRKRQIGGCGYLVDDMYDTSIGEAYDYCAYVLSTGKRRYMLAYVIDQRREAADNVTEMLLSCSGQLFMSCDRIKMTVSSAKSSVVEFTEDDYTELKLTEKLFDECKNRVGIEFVDPTQNDTRCVAWGAEDRVDQELRGIDQLVITIPSITDGDQACRLANQAFYELMLNTIGIEFYSDLKAHYLEPGDVFKMSNVRRAWVEKLFICRSIAETELCTFSIVAQEYNPSIYNDSVAGPVEIFDYGSPANPYAPVSDVTGLAIEESEFYLNGDGSVASDIIVAFNEVADASRFHLNYYQVELKKGAADYVVVGTTTAPNYRLFNVEQNVSYIVRIRTVSMRGVVSTGTASASLLVVGKDSPPANVTNFAYVFNEKIVLNWSENNETDLGGYEIRTADSDWGTDGSALVYRGRAKPFTIDAPASRSPGTYYAKAFDTSGNYSETAATCTPTNAAPAAPTGLTAIVNFLLAYVSWANVADTDIVKYELYKDPDNSWGTIGTKIAELVGLSANLTGDVSKNGEIDSATTTAFTTNDIALTGGAIATGSVPAVGDRILFQNGANAGTERTVTSVSIVGSNVTVGFSALPSAPSAGDSFMIHDTYYLKVRAVDVFGGGSFSAAVQVKHTGITANMLPDNIILARHILVATLEAITANLGTMTAGTIIGLLIQSATSGSRIEFDADSFVAYDASDNEVFKIVLTGTDAGDVIFGNVASGKYIKYDRSAGEMVYGDISIESDDYVEDTTGFKISKTVLDVSGMLKGRAFEGGHGEFSVIARLGRYKKAANVATNYIGTGSGVQDGTTGYYWLACVNGLMWDGCGESLGEDMFDHECTSASGYPFGAWFTKRPGMKKVTFRIKVVRNSGGGDQTWRAAIVTKSADSNPVPVSAGIYSAAETGFNASATKTFAFELDISSLTDSVTYYVTLQSNTIDSTAGHIHEAEIFTGV